MTKAKKQGAPSTAADVPCGDCFRHGERWYRVAFRLGGATFVRHATDRMGELGNPFQIRRDLQVDEHVPMSRGAAQGGAVTDPVESGMRAEAPSGPLVTRNSRLPAPDKIEQSVATGQSVAPGDSGKIATEGEDDS